MMGHARNDRSTLVVQVGGCAEGLATLTHKKINTHTLHSSTITNSADRLRIQSQRQKRCGTSKKQKGIVKSEHAKGLILERRRMMMMMIMIMLRFSGCFLRGTRHARLEVLTVVILKVRAYWDCNIWVLLIQGTTHCTTPR
jgi:hypothetical protein